MSQRLRVDGDIFENAPRVDADLFSFFKTDKKVRFQKDLDTFGRGLTFLIAKRLKYFLYFLVIFKAVAFCEIQNNKKYDCEDTS